MGAVDQYIQNVIKGGDEMSARLEKIFAQTLGNSPHVDIVSQGMNGIKVIRPPVGQLALVHSLSGLPHLDDPREYARSVVDRLVEAAEAVGAKPVAFANVIDASNSDPGSIIPYAEGLAELAHAYKLAVPNGEFAVLGNRVCVPANVSATMLSFISRENSHLPEETLTNWESFTKNEIIYAVFDPHGKALYMNSDGVGTKTEFYERSRNYERAKLDSFAMKLDDLIKVGGTACVVSDVAETNASRREQHEFQGGWRGGLVAPHGEDIIYIVQHEEVGNRISSYRERVLAFNLSGSAISTIDESRLQKPLRPNAGEYLVAIRGKPNPRSNGITDKRITMIQLFGQEWHNMREGELFMEYLGEPSTVFYGVFKQFIDTNLVSSVYHLSGGAFKGKLGKPLAKYGLYVTLNDMFAPDWRELTLAGARFTNAETAYSKWPMGNEGFVSTSQPHEVVIALHEFGLEGRVVGQIEEARNGKTGVELTGIKASNGENVYYSGKE